VPHPSRWETLAAELEPLERMCGFEFMVVTMLEWDVHLARLLARPF